MNASLALPFLLSLAATATSAPPVDEGAPAGQDAGSPECLADTVPRAPNVVWSGPAGTLTYARLAECAAPILWVSPDESAAPYGPEPYEETKGCDLDQPIDHTPGRTTVYYSFTEPSEAYLSTNSVDLWHEMLIRLDFKFFYRRDPSHCGDLESLRTELRVYKVTPLFEVRLVRAIGNAHGNAFLANELFVGGDGSRARDVRLPLTVLIEENKHASVPDRNGDGMYTPGYDVNVGVRDAWGLRDNFGSHVVAPGFDASMAKLTRVRRQRLFPPLRRAERTIERWRRAGDEAWGETNYSLRSASEARPQRGSRHPTESVAPSRWQYDGVAMVAYRYDGLKEAAVFSIPLVGDRFGRIVPWLRWNLGTRLVMEKPFDRKDIRISFEALVSPSAGGRLVDWYVAAGRFTRTTTGRWRLLPYEYEAGLRLRWKPIYLGGRIPLMGARLGIRTDSWSASGARFVFEAGGGLF